MKKWKILLVDDEVEFASTLAERLNLRGMDALTACNGEEALRMIEASPPSVVLLDVMMPGINGLEVLQRIKDQYPALPVILLTGQGSTRSGIEGMRYGAYDYLMKPVAIEELVEKIRGATTVG